MHIFLTGEIQIGKSTVLRKTMEGLGFSVGGFRTFYKGDRRLPDKVLCIAGVNDAYMDEAQVVVRFIDGKPTAFPEQFDRVGGMLLRKARESAGLIIMDECGRLEREATLFQEEVLKTICGDIPVLGVVRYDAGGWTHDIRNHPNVQVITVDRDNRDRLPAELIAKLRG